MTTGRLEAKSASKTGLRLLVSADNARTVASTVNTRDRTLHWHRVWAQAGHRHPRAKNLQKRRYNNGPTDVAETSQDTSGGPDALDFVKYSLVPFSDKLDPFAQLPVALDRFQEHLVSFYLLHYPKVTYGLSVQLKPHPVATNFSIAVNNPPNFQVALARSALYRISLEKYTTPSEKHELEVAVIRHKGEAIRMVKEMSSKANTPGDKLNLIAGIISLGTLDNRTGAEKTASMHFMAVRRLLRSIGGPLGITSALLSRVMVHFECIYGTVNASYVWDQSDTSRLLLDINGFFADVWYFWKSPTRRNSVVSSTESTTSTADRTSIASQSSISTSPIEAFALQPGSSLHEALSRPLKVDGQELTPLDKMKLTFQLTCLLTFTHIILDHASDSETLKKYISNINKIIDDAQLLGQPCNNHMWLLQVHDQSSTHDERIWRAASFVWLLRHLPYNVQKDIRDWLLAFCTGQSAAGRMVKRLDTFYFSYAMLCSPSAKSRNVP